VHGVRRLPFRVVHWNANPTRDCDSSHPESFSKGDANSEYLCYASKDQRWVQIRPWGYRVRHVILDAAEKIEFALRVCAPEIEV
jgi:hypothetical protein